MCDDIGDAGGHDDAQSIALVEAFGGVGSNLAADSGGQVLCLERQLRVPPQLFDRLLSPLASAIDGEREPISLKGFDQEIDEIGLRPFGVDQLLGRGCDDDRRVGVLPVHLVGEPQAVVARHHDVDDGEVVVLRSQCRKRLVRARRRVRSQAQRFDPTRHDVAHRRLVVDDQN